MIPLVQRRWLYLCFILLSSNTLGGCGSPCREVEHRTIDVSCTTEKSFDTIHLDSAALFEEFLKDDCQTANLEPKSLANNVDFTKEIVFCASGPLNDPELGCLRKREIKDAEVCTDGIQLIFDDTLQPPETSFCSNQLWFFCEALSRNDVRPALDNRSLSETIAFWTTWRFFSKLLGMLHQKFLQGEGNPQCGSV